MKKLLIIGIFAFAGLLSCTANEPSIPREKSSRAVAQDSVVYANLGESLYNVISSPSRVSMYYLKAKETINPDDIVIESPFVKDHVVVEKMSKTDIAILQYLLPFDGENYHNDQARVRSPYLPLIDFVFVKKKVEVHMLISLSDYSWTVVYDGKVQFNWNYSDKKQIARFCKQFINTK